MSLELTRHAAIRARQRGLKQSDFSILLRYGTTTRDGILLRRRDANDAVTKLKKEINQLQRLAGVLAVCDGGQVITAYRADRKKVRSQLK